MQTQQPPADFEYGVIAGGRGTALMAGPRFELRRPKYGLFIFGQAGYQSWSQAPGPFLAVPYQGGFYISRAAPERQTFFASGGGVGGEYTPASRIHLRASIAERAVRYQPAGGSTVTCSACSAAPVTWQESEVFSAGVWVGTGPALRGTGSLREAVPSHRFLDRTNLLLITGSTLAGVTDAVVTRHFLAQGISEGDAIERPFIQHGIGGFIAIGLITETAAIGFMYGLHHMGHPVLERLLPIAVMLGEGRTSYRVVQNTY